MWCKDPFLTYLKEFGYNVIRLPKADVKPLQVLARCGKDLNRLGEINNLLVAGDSIPLPKLKENTRAASISGQRTGDLSVGVGLSILGTVIGAMGGSKLGLDTKYQNAKTTMFEFQDVFEDTVEIIELDKFLGDADINPFSRHVAELLEADDLYITTSTIKSTKFTIEAKKSDGTALELTIPDIQGIVGGNVKVSGAASVTSKICYESPIPLVFGFQAVRLFYDNGCYTAIEPLDSGSAGMKALGKAPSDGAARLMTDGPFLRLTGV